MAWTYADWMSQATDAARLTRLRLHHSEISAAIMADISADGKSRSNGVLEQRLRALEEKIEEYERKTGEGSYGPRISNVTLANAGD